MQKGRYLYSFNYRCNEDPDILLEDETTKIFLSTEGDKSDVDEEMLEFLRYIEHSTDEIAEVSHSQLVKVIHKKVNQVKTDRRMEVQYMTLLQIEKTRFEEGYHNGHEAGRAEGKAEGVFTVAKALLDILDDATISLKTGLTIEEVSELRKNS